MEEIKIKNIMHVGLFFVMGIMLISLVGAWGVATSYWDGEGDEDNPLILEPGDSRVVSLDLQNMADLEEVKLEAELVEGSEIASLIDENLNYVLPVGSKDIKVNLRVSIPEDATIGERVKVAVSFVQVVEDEGEMLQIASSIIQSFPVLIGSESSEVLEAPPSEETEEGFNVLLSLIVIVLLIIIVIIYLIIKKRRKKTIDLQ